MSRDVSCQGSVHQAILAFLDSDDYEHAVRLAVSLGGDADTIACIAGGIAQAQ
jgi:ADP-ribosylglycohydrolase